VVLFWTHKAKGKGELLMKKLIMLCVVGLFLAACASGPTVAPEPADPALKSAKAVFELKCSICHGIDRPLGKNKTPAEWSSTVKRMQEKAPEKMSDADVKAIVAYLNAVQGPKK
jgi:mono/diheme cytochrome c family protein